MNNCSLVCSKFAYNICKLSNSCSQTVPLYQCNQKKTCATLSRLAIQINQSSQWNWWTWPSLSPAIFKLENHQTANHEITVFGHEKGRTKKKISENILIDINEYIFFLGGKLASIDCRSGQLQPRRVLMAP